MSNHSAYDLKHSVIKLAAAKSFTAGKPAPVTDEEKRQKNLQQMKERIYPVPYLCEEKDYWNYDKSVLRFRVKLEAKHIRDVAFRLAYDKEGLLYISEIYKGKLGFVHNLDEVVAFAENLRSAALHENRHYEKLVFEATKKAKIKSLKQQVIFTKIKELCEAERVKYIIQQDYRNKVKLLVCLSHADRMEVDIPFNNYQTTLQNLQTAIQSIRELIGKGVSLKVKSSVYANQSMGWV